MKNKEISLAIALIFVIVVTACAQQYDSENDFRATPLDNGRSVEIIEYIGSKWTVRIPPRIQGLPVTHIRNNAFKGKSLVSVTIPNSVTHIGNTAFFDNQIGSINIPDSVISIGFRAFDSGSLNAINVSSGNSIYASENGILYNKNKTTLYKFPAGKTESAFVIPNTVTNIGEAAFFGNSNLINITVPNSVTSIGPSAFAYCTGLTNIIIQNSGINIGEYAFEGCTGLAGKYFDVLRLLAVTMGNYESTAKELLRDHFDDELMIAITSQPNIINIFSIWKPNALDGMDSNYIGRPGSTVTGQYAMTYSRNNNQILVIPNYNVGEFMAHINSPYARREWIEHTFLNVNGQETFLLRIIVPVIVPRTNEVIGIVGCEFVIR